MSFSMQIKDEIANHIGNARHCQIAELAAIITLCGAIETDISGALTMYIFSENKNVIRKCFTLLKKTFNINTCSLSDMDEYKKGNSYYLKIEDDDKIREMLKAFKTDDKNFNNNRSGLVDPMLIMQPCCKRAFIRGVFLAAGSVSDPNKFYHMEIVCDTPVKACQIRDVVNSFGADAKVIQRKKYFVVYVKEGTQIVDLLNVMEAHVALMDLENVRIIKEMRNSVNRRVNCETANLNKTVSAAMRQIKDIEYIRDAIGLDSLNDALKSIAVARLENPDANLKELGESVNPPVGKSGVNHRLRKLSQIAEELKNGQ